MHHRRQHLQARPKLLDQTKESCEGFSFGESRGVFLKADEPEDDNEEEAEGEDGGEGEEDEEPGHHGPRVYNRVAGFWYSCNSVKVTMTTVRVVQQPGR